MDKKSFENIIKNLEEILDACREIGATYKCGAVAAVEEKRDAARWAQGQLDKFLQSELYHLLGMGCLTVAQSTEVIKMVHELGACRPVVKTVATMPDGMTQLPPIKESNYRSAFAGIEIKKNMGGMLYE